MKDLLKMVRGFEDFASLGVTSIEKVSEAESRLQLTFADDYKDYLIAFGAATFDARELTGICDDAQLSVIATTERAREYYPHFPKNAYVIEEMLIDHVIIIQTADGKVYCYGPQDHAKHIAMSLYDYLFSPDKNN